MRNLNTPTVPAIVDEMTGQSRSRDRGLFSFEELLQNHLNDDRHRLDDFRMLDQVEDMHRHFDDVRNDLRAIVRVSFCVY